MEVSVVACEHVGARADHCDIVIGIVRPITILGVCRGPVQVVQGVAGRFAQGGGGVAGWRLQAAAPCGDYAAAGAHTLDEISAVRGRFRMFLSSLGRPRCVR